MGFHHVGQAGLELPASGDPPALASKIVRITDVSHCAGPEGYFIYVENLLFSAYVASSMILARSNVLLQLLHKPLLHHHQDAHLEGSG